MKDISLSDEKYELNFIGKSYAKHMSTTPTTTSLVPDEIENSKEENKNSENLYIIGDNLDALKHLLASYANKIKCIYIDPPYNSKSTNVIYSDSFSFDTKELTGTPGITKKEAKRIPNLKGKNSHSAWLTCMYPRLILARELLSDDGVIFISIDDNEQANLKIACNEIFKEENFIAQLVWEKVVAPKNDAKYVSINHDYVLMFAKNRKNFIIGRLPITEKIISTYKNPDNDPRGVWKPKWIKRNKYHPKYTYPIKLPSGRVIVPTKGYSWILPEKTFLEKFQDNRIQFGANGDGMPQMKCFLSEQKMDGMVPASLLYSKDTGYNKEGSLTFNRLFDNQITFPFPKPTRLLQRLLKLANLKHDSTVLDFFSGSATTAHAVMQLNAEDGGNRKFILAQLPERIKEDKPAYKAGYRTIDEIGRERIRRAAKKIKEETSADIDYGFKTYRLI